MKNVFNVTPLKIIADILNAERALSAEIVLLALNIVRNNPEVDLALAMMIARDEWVSSPEYKAMTKADLDDIDNTMAESAVALKEAQTAIVNKFSKHVVSGYHEDIFNPGNEDEHEVLKQNRGIL